MGQRMSERILWIDPTRTTFVESFDDCKTVGVARRRTPDHVWGPPIWCQLDTSWRSSSGAWLVSVPGGKEFNANAVAALTHAMIDLPSGPSREVFDRLRAALLTQAIYLGQ